MLFAIFPAYFWRISSYINYISYIWWSSQGTGPWLVSRILIEEMVTFLYDFTIWWQTHNAFHFCNEHYAYASHFSNHDFSAVANRHRKIWHRNASNSQIHHEILDQFSELIQQYITTEILLDVLRSGVLIKSLKYFRNDSYLVITARRRRTFL